MGLKFDDDVRIVVEEGSISDAAKRLNISQPALSARIRKLEEQYGIRIFKRNRRPVTLTDEGKLYLDYMTRVQNMDKEFRRTVAQTEELLAGELVVGGTHLYTCRFLPPAVREFGKRYPGVTVDIVNEKAPVLTMMASKGEVDLFVTNMAKQAQGICYEPLFEVKMYFCVPREYPVNREFAEHGFDLSKLEDYPFIMLDKSLYMGSTMRKLLNRYHVNPSKIIYTDQAITAYSLSEAGAGISLMYERSVDDIADDSGPCLYTTADEEMRSEISIAYAEHAPLSPAARAFAKTLKAVWGAE